MTDKDSLVVRLRRVEGQIKGIQKMVEEDKFCGDILIQISAARSALNNVGGLILENYMKHCLVDSPEGEGKNMDQLIEIMLKYTK
ncbi:MAG: metal-sensitive transcriptional regulator [Gudongella sp.]|nr:metal-sensitive transcriptional regulator [Gudongella sp.]